MRKIWESGGNNDIDKALSDAMRIALSETGPYSGYVRN